MIHVVMVEPEIPQNTGNIMRLTACTGVTLHLVKPLGFSLEDKYMKRAGLDYWDKANIIIHESIDDFMREHKDDKLYYATTKGSKRYNEVDYDGDTYILFGPESRGLDEALLHDRYDRCIRIPMKSNCRSLNLSNSVAIVVYEAMRQHDFEGLEDVGHLTKY